MVEVAKKPLLTGQEVIARYSDTNSTMRRDFIKENLKGARLRNTVLLGVDFSFSDLSSADFTGSTIRASFSRATLSGASMHEIDAQSVIFNGADLSGVQFNGANLSKSKFRGANLEGADFTGADLSHADFKEAQNLEKARGLGSAKLNGVVGLTEEQKQLILGLQSDTSEAVEGLRQISRK